MKRALIALATVAFVMVAISIARANSGEDDAPKAEPTSTTNRDIIKEQAKAQSEEVMKAQADLAEMVAEDRRADGRQRLVVTLREEVPGEVWRVKTIAGKRTCVIPSALAMTFIDVTDGQSGSTLTSDHAPREATLLRGGACEASLEMFVPDVEQYRVTIGGDARAKFDPADIQNADHPIKVTIAG